MSLMRLLSLGRSLNEVKSVGRYHVPQKPGMPSFSFGKPAVRISAAPAVAGTCQVKAAGSEKAVPAAAAMVEKPVANGAAKRSNPFAAEQTTAADGHAPLQSELTLEKVQVVRNDLSEADFEIVPRQELPRQADIKPYRKRNKPADVPADDMLGAKAWNWLGSRLFGAAAKHG